MGVRQTRGFHVARWIEANCVHTNGEWIGRPFRLLPWQKRLLLELFEVGDDGLRRYRWALAGVPKKNGKTELAAALALYFLIGDGEASPLVVCAAASEEQADLVFGAARTMAKMSPTLSQVCEPFEREILVPSIPGAKLKRVAAAAGTNDGQNIHAVICDELHEWQPGRGENVWNVLTNGTGARRQPMVLQITTAGYDLDGTVCGRQYQHGKRVRSGEVSDPTYYFHWVESSPDADHRDPATWEAANPSYGVLVHEPFFRDQLTKKTEAVFRRYFLNQWTASEEAWLPFGAWDACEQSESAIDPSLPVRVGVDISNVQDATAIVVAQRQGEDVIARLSKVWANPYPPNHSLHDSWKVPRTEVKAHLRELFAAYPAPACEIDGEIKRGPEFNYDPWNFGEAAEELSGEGLAMVAFPQTDQRMVPAAGDLYELVMTGRLKHDGDPILKQHIANVTPDQKPRGVRLSKPKGSKRKIDAAIALAMAAHRALMPVPEATASIYETRGVVVL
jgi:phage terminase large subunit-like protein